MQENSLIAKITGKGELPINKMSGFRTPDKEEHEVISAKITYKLRKETALAILWIGVGILFIYMYLYLFFHVNPDKKNSFLLSAAVFFIMILISLYRFFFVDLIVSKAIKDKSYTVRKVKIHHFMPGIRKNTVKIQDEKGSVYYYEFILSHKQKKIYKKNPDAEFTIIKLDGDKDIYSITYLAPKSASTH